jgi:hypothetical protein
MLIITLLFSLYCTTISAQDEYDKQDDCTFALQMYDGDELLNQVLLDAVDSTGHPYAYILVNGRVWDPYYDTSRLYIRELCRCAYGQFPFTFYPATQIINERFVYDWFDYEYKDELRYYYFKRSRGNPFALYFFDGKDLYYSTNLLTKTGEPYIVGDGHFQIPDEIEKDREGYEIEMELNEQTKKYAIPKDENIANWDKIQKRINTFRILKGTPETLSINTPRPENSNITLIYDANSKELHLYGTNEATISLYTAGGQTYREYHSSGIVHLDGIPHGIYIAKVISKDGQMTVKSIVI